MSRYKQYLKNLHYQRSEALLMREAIQSGQCHVVRSLLEQGFHPNDNTLDDSPLLYAVETGNTEIVRMLLDAGANPDFAGVYWYFSTPLHVAAAAGNAAIVRLLLEHGATPNAANDDHYGITPLHEAILKGHAACVRVLLEHGANPEEIFTTVFDGSQPNCTPLTIAIESGNEALVRALIEGGANINAPNAAGEHPLSVAVRLGGQPIIYALAEAPGVDLNAADEGGAPGLFRLIADRDEASVAMLLYLGADPNAVFPANGNTPLHAAASHHQADTIDLLRKLGANPNVRNRDGKLPRDLTSSARCQALLESRA